MCHLTLRSRAGSKSPPKKHPKKASGKSRHTSPPLRSQLVPGFPLMLSTLERVWSPLSQLSVGRDRAVLKSIWSASKELCLCFWNSASFYQSRCFFRENCFLHERSLFANTSSEIPTECSAVTHENRPAGFFKPNLFSRVDSKNWSKSLSLKNRKLEKFCWPGNRNTWYKWYPQHRIQAQG